VTEDKHDPAAEITVGRAGQLQVSALQLNRPLDEDVSAAVVLSALEGTIRFRIVQGRPGALHSPAHELAAALRDQTKTAGGEAGVVDLGEGLGLGVSRDEPSYTLSINLPGGTALLDVETPLAREIGSLVAQAVELNEHFLVGRIGRPKRRRGGQAEDEDVE
jgi:hypothetical protein